MLPLFLPDGVNFNKLLRALIGIIMFQSAYMAEVSRGGLQAIPKGQYEAASSLGLGYWRRMGLIIAFHKRAAATIRVRQAQRAAARLAV